MSLSANKVETKPTLHKANQYLIIVLHFHNIIACQLDFLIYCN